jgi:hypothetical protein
MGAVKQLLARRTLSDREKHNSRLFVDLCENIHIHYREYRLIFSLDEYFEFADIVDKSTRDVRNYLANNPEYREQEYPTTIMIACGVDRQRKFLQNSPKPNQSAYHNNDFAVELQEEHVTDEIHVHWRDLRIALNRENFKDVADAFREATEALGTFEKDHAYQRQEHLDRKIDGLNNAALDGERVQGATSIAIKDIRSFWHDDLKSQWKHDGDYIRFLKAKIQNNEAITPIVVTEPQDGMHTIVNGHHRYFAAMESGLARIDCVVLPMTFEQTEDLRHAERCLKRFDEATGYRYGTTTFFNDYLAFKFNRHYRNDYQRRIRKMHQWWIRKPLRRIKKSIKVVTRRIAGGVKV